MLDLAILIILIIGFFIGLKRGFILQLIHLTGFIIAFITASLYYDKLAPKLTLWIPYPNFGGNAAIKLISDGTNAEMAFYNAIAYIAIFLAVKIVMQIIGSMLDFIAHLPVLKQLNVWAGGILGFIEVYLVIFILLYIAALLPMEFLQNALDDSIMVNLMIKNTPIFSDYIKELWFEYVTA
ncbi:MULTISPECIES: CvpA family protein [unclassified Bacillus (in: firmicutes)]|uniref:CvpA family protein n=1 Tax=unclassified Bacillus (in: firmicutes) TaxID=185979 RepID=UPI0008E0EF87|nr:MULTISPECIES: CvpA family protein [unclassified Bacillus (in: firmicutes)]SFB17000.1 Uncharacterized membrane protein, required for colicin V production [Bacillus sp. UNCCL13]SFQ77693.1 Uncharacterized membrane protein, required for colicin V production [Bacillus sp. cl95]